MPTMYLNKFLHPANFEYPSSLDSSGTYSVHRKQGVLELTSFGENIFRVTAKGKGWNRNESTWTPYPDGEPKGSTPKWKLSLAKATLGFEAKNRKKQSVLKSVPGKAFGICGESFVMNFLLDGTEKFYGMGEKFLGLELSGACTSFWNTDMMADFAGDVFQNGRPDPAYVSIPYLIIQTKKGWVGILVNNPGQVMINTGAQMKVEGLLAAGDSSEMLVIGAHQGQPDLFFLFADSLAELTREYQQLVGTTPLPPVWSLGYHQCRWGYTSAKELEGYKRRFKKEKFPVDGLWLDIDYMNGYRVFTFHEEHFPNVEEDLSSLQSDGQKVIPIIDPGVKIDPEWDVFQQGLEKDVYCKTPQGTTFVGQVWPGDTAFVDYSQKKGKDWWRDKITELAERGIEGCWNDMNDPALGFVGNESMRWADGKKDHWTHHNQFALEMAESTRDGFLKARPDERPFILSRSGSTGMARAAAIWHGDSTSNYHWLQLTLPTALNLSLSGVPFNGADLGGFDGTCSEQLFKDYYKACFLFPFCRNHASFHSPRQEPWVYGTETLDVTRNYIQDRYRLRPYLYQLFVEQEEQGEAILRPLFYDFPKHKEIDLSEIEDQFMVGPALMQAPLVSEERSRKVALPKGRWWDFMKSKWVEGGKVSRLTPSGETTPLYGRAGTALPMETSRPESHHWQGKEFDLHLFLEAEGTPKSLKGTVVSDDGHSFAYKRGERSRVGYSAKVKDAILRISTRHSEKGYGEILLAFVVYSRFKKVFVNGKEVKRESYTYEFAGKQQRVYKVSPLD